MDLLENPEVKTTYDKCKYVVKLWEHNFKKTKNRLPSKLDIREADQEVRHAYRKYYQLKTAALEQSFKDVDGFNSEEENITNLNITQSLDPPIFSALSNKGPNEPDEPPAEEPGVNVWGSHLDVKPKPIDKMPEAVPSKLKENISKKLFCGSKVSKRNPRKSQSFSQRNKTSSFESGFLSQPTTSLSFSSEPTEVDGGLSFEGIFKKSIKVASAQVKFQSQSTNIFDKVLNNKGGSVKSVDFGWLQRAGQSSGVEIEQPERGEQLVDLNLNYGSDDDVIENSDEDESSLGRYAKKARLSSPVLSQSTITNKPTTNKQSQSIMFPKVVEIKQNTDTIKSQTIIEKQTSQEVEGFEVGKKKQTVYSVIPNSPKSNKEDEFSFLENDKPKENRRKKTKPKKNSKNVIDIVISKRKLPSRSTKPKASMADDFSGEEDPYFSESNSNDPEFNPEKEKKHNEKSNLDDILSEIEDTKNKSTKKTKSVKKGQTTSKLPEENPEENTYELEYSVKPRVAAPRFKNIKKLIKIETSAAQVKSLEQKTKTKKEQAADSLEKKVKSGTLNENFVQINLKKKIYVRGKKNMNFSKYKKQQWRNIKKAKSLAGPDMDMGGCDGGMLTCFNCGKTGHFARQCKNNKGDGLLPLSATGEEEPCQFPTLEEAAQMAKESVLAIRKPNRQKLNDDDEEDTETENNDDLFDEIDNDAFLAAALHIEEAAAHLDLQPYCDPIRTVPPYYSSPPTTTADLYDALRQFGHSHFRPGQEQAITRILCGRSTLVTLSTGSGKSLCYQIPAYLYSQRSPCISLIISPLVSLMEDQVTGIPSFLRAACLHTNKTKSQREKIMEAITSGSLDVLLVSPEAVVAGERNFSFGSLLRQLPPIAFACIDEAHCVSQWSHNFRSSYLMICRVLREKLGVRTILGLTATATRSTGDNIVQHLAIADGRSGIIADTPLPDNLLLSVSKDYNRDQALVSLLTSDRLKHCQSIIIYCTRREECNRVTSFLRTRFRDEALPAASKKRKRTSPQVEPYHAGLSASRRRTIQRAFMSGELRIVVATVAFGMGINKSDIRAVIHYNMPKNFESYVQEMGRAGRDGLAAHCHLFLDARGGDEHELRRHIFADSVDRHVIRKLLERIFLPCACKERCPKHEVAFEIEETVQTLDLPEENISTLLCYLELHEKKYVELLSPAYTVCKVISYGGAAQIRRAAKSCPPLAMALALRKTDEDETVLEFAVVDIAAAIGWDSGICKHKLKNLEWTSENGQPKRSTLSVQFSRLGFRLLAPGNLSPEELDEALDSIHQHTNKQEEMALLQLRALHQTLVDVTAKSYRECLGEEQSEVGVRLKERIRGYFESEDPLEGVVLSDKGEVDEEAIVTSVRGLILMYRDNNFTGRAVARIFHGIQSPNYPAVIWGRCRFWRSHLGVDFHTICRIATKEILGLR